MMDVTKGHSEEWWMITYQRRSLRLKKLIDYNAPPMAISREIKLVRDSLNALEELCGQPSHCLVIVDSVFSK